MAQVSLSPQVKEQLKNIKEEDGHTSVDSVVRTLLERSQLAEDYRKILQGEIVVQDRSLIEEKSDRLQSDDVDSDEYQGGNTGAVITNRVLSVVEQLPFESKAVLLAILNLDKGDNADFVTEQEVFSTARSLCSEIDMETISQSRVSELIVELDMLGLVSAEVSVQGRDKEVLDVVISTDVDDIHQGLNNTPFSHLDFQQPINTQVGMD